MPGIVLELLGCTQSSQTIGTFVHGVVFDPLRAEPYVMPEKSGQVEEILNVPPRRQVNVTAQFPSNVDLPHVPQGNGKICKYLGLNRTI